MRRAARLVVGCGIVLGAGVALAGPAAAVADPTRPGYAVTSGPSCHPGGVQIRVDAGTVAYRVVLATTRTPGGEDSADLRPGETVVLHTGDVGWGETIDSRLEFTALDGSGDTFSDELVPFSFTRPSEEDCAAIAPSLIGSSPATVPASDPGPAGSGDGDVAAGPLPGDLPVRVAAAEVPVAPATSGADWASIAAGVSLAGSTAGLLLAARRRAAAARGTMAG